MKRHNPFFKHWINRLIFYLMLLLPAASEAQNYVSPHKANAGVNIAIEIKEKKDLDYIQKNLNKFYGVQFVRVNGNVDIERVSKVIELLDDVEDVQLIGFTGEFNEEVIDRLDWVNNITIFLKNGKEDQVLMTPNIGKLRKLTLIFEVTPEDYYFLESLSQVRKLHLIAPFVKKEAQAAVAAVTSLKYLEDFGISLDKIPDLPAEIRNIKNLKSLTIYDNLSWITTKYLENLAVTRQNIEYSEGEKVKSLNFKYEALDIEMTSYDYNRIYTVFPSSRFAPIVNQSGDSASYADFAEFVKQAPLENAQLRTSVVKDHILPEYQQNQFFLQGDNSTDKVFYLGSDVVVMVPKNAIGYENNEALEGKYDLSIYAGLRPVEMTNLGLNMLSSRDSSLSPKILLEIEAVSSAGNRLVVRDGYFIKVAFLNVVDTALNFYAYNVKTKKWDNFFDYDYAFDDSKIVPIDFYNFYSGKKTARESYPGEIADLDTRFETQGYYYLLDPGVVKQAFESTGGYYFAKKTTKGNDQGSYTLRRGTKLVGLKKEYLDKKHDKGVVKFRVYDKTQNLFPELKAFDNYVFEVETSMNSRQFSQQFISGKVYSDIRFVKEGSDYYCELKTEEGYWKIKLLQPLVKYKSAERKAKKAQAEFLKRMNRYFALRQEKNKKLLQYFSNQENSSILNAKRQLLLGSVKPKGMTVKEFKVRTTGTFTMASAFKPSDSFSIKALITDKGGIPIQTRRIAVVHYNPVLIEWYEVKKPEDFTLIRMEPSKFGFMIASDDKGAVYSLNAEQFKSLSLNDNTVIYLPMSEMPRPQRNTADLEKFLGVNKKHN